MGLEALFIESSKTQVKVKDDLLEDLARVNFQLQPGCLMLCLTNISPRPSLTIEKKVLSVSTLYSHCYDVPKLGYTTLVFLVDDLAGLGGKLLL